LQIHLLAYQSEAADKPLSCKSTLGVQSHLLFSKGAAVGLSEAQNAIIARQQELYAKICGPSVLLQEGFQKRMEQEL